MEQNDNFKQMNHKLYCETDSCDKQRTHNCDDHDQLLCSSCSIEFHDKSTEHFKESFDAKSFDEELKTFHEELHTSNEKFANSVGSKFHEASLVKEEEVKLQTTPTESDQFTGFSESTELRRVTAEGGISSQKAADKRK